MPLMDAGSHDDVTDCLLPQPSPASSITARPSWPLCHTQNTYPWDAD